MISLSPLGEAQAQSLASLLASATAFAALTGLGRLPGRLIDRVAGESGLLRLPVNLATGWAIAAVGLDDASFLEQLYPGLTFRRADGLDLPFPAESFDVVHSSAVLEHVGDRERQRRFVTELVRVARRGAFFTTPNRWFPIEFHTQLPLVHWLPKPGFHAVLRRTGRGFFASDDTLNLLDRASLRTLVLPRLAYRLGSVGLVGWPTNLLLWIRKSAS